MLKTVYEYINMLLTNNLLAIFIAAGAFLVIFEAPSMHKEKFATEKKIAKIMGIGYILFGVGMYIILLFIHSFAL